MHRGRSMCETCWTHAAPCWTGSAMFTEDCVFLCPSTRPWDPLNDLIQFEKDGCIQTKVRHRTPMVRSASVVSLSTQQGSRRDNYLSQVRPSVPFPPSFYPQSLSLLPPHHRLPPPALSVHSSTNQSPFCKATNHLLPDLVTWPRPHFQLLFFLCALRRLQVTFACMHPCVIFVCFFGCIRHACLQLGSKTQYLKYCFIHNIFCGILKDFNK